jgi:hypothetical protein
LITYISLNITANLRYTSIIIYRLATNLLSDRLFVLSRFVLSQLNFLTVPTGQRDKTELQTGSIWDDMFFNVVGNILRH